MVPQRSWFRMFWRETVPKDSLGDFLWVFGPLSSVKDIEYCAYSALLRCSELKSTAKVSLERQSFVCFWRSLGGDTNPTLILTYISRYGVVNVRCIAAHLAPANIAGRTVGQISHRYQILRLGPSTIRHIGPV